MQTHNFDDDGCFDGQWGEKICQFPVIARRRFLLFHLKQKLPPYETKRLSSPSVFYSRHCNFQPGAVAPGNHANGSSRLRTRRNIASIQRGREGCGSWGSFPPRRFTADKARANARNDRSGKKGIQPCPDSHAGPSRGPTSKKTSRSVSCRTKLGSN